MDKMPPIEEPPSIPMKCEVCEWIEDFHPSDLNIEQCVEGFCEDCDNPRIFVL